MPEPLPLGLDFSQLAQQDAPGDAAISEPLIIVWGTDFMGKRPGGLWRWYAGGRLRQVRPSASTPQHYLYDVLRLPDGVYLARSARTSRRYLSEFRLAVKQGRAENADNEDIIRVWLSES